MARLTTFQSSQNCSRPPSQVIVNADDFGRSSEINHAVIRAHREGVLTSASLMVTGDAVDEAVKLAWETPTLAVGLHLVVIDGRAVLPPAEIPNLVDENGLFSKNAVRAGFHYFFHKQARVELAREIAAQFERFAAWGLPLSHVDGHCHLHLHPTAFNCLLPMAAHYGARGVRIPCDDFWLAVRCDASRLGTKIAWTVAFALLSCWCRSRLRRFPLFAVERTYGLLQTGRMHEAYVLKLLRHLGDCTAEIYFHPTTGPGSDAWGSNPGELETLVSPVVRRTLREQGVQLTTYSALNQESETHVA